MIIDSSRDGNPRFVLKCPHCKKRQKIKFEHSDVTAFRGRECDNNNLMGTPMEQRCERCGNCVSYLVVIGIVKWHPQRVMYQMATGEETYQLEFNKEDLE